MTTAAELRGYFRASFPELANKPGTRRLLEKLTAASTNDAYYAAGILWAPAGGGDAQTWAEVMVFVAAAKAPLAIFVRSPAGPAQIPPGVYEMHGSWFACADTGDQPQCAVSMQDGAVLRNLYGVAREIRLIGNPTTGPCLLYDTPTMGTPSITLDDSAALQNDGTVAMIDVPAHEDFAVTFHQNGEYLVGTNGAALVGLLGAGSTLIIELVGSAYTLVDPTIISGGAGTVVAVLHNGEATFPPTGTFPSGTPYPNFTGLVSNNPYGTNAGSGPTALRPDGLFQPIIIGAAYYDTDIFAGVRWNGTTWIPLGLPIASGLIYQPGGVADGIVFTDWNVLYQQMQRYRNDQWVECDGTFTSPVVIPPGDYPLITQLRGQLKSGGATAMDNKTHVYLSDGVRMVNLIEANNNIMLHCRATMAGTGISPIEIHDGDVCIFERGAACVADFDVPVIKVRPDSLPQGGPVLALSLGGTSGSGNNDIEVVAAPAVLTGTVDMTTLTYGPGGTLDGLSFTIITSGSVPVNFVAPADAAAAAAQITATPGVGVVASIEPLTNFLVLTTTAVPGQIQVQDGTLAVTTIGFTNNQRAASNSLLIVLDSLATLPNNTLTGTGSAVVAISNPSALLNLQIPFAQPGIAGLVVFDLTTGEWGAHATFFAEGLGSNAAPTAVPVGYGLLTTAAPMGVHPARSGLLTAHFVTVTGTGNGADAAKTLTVELQVNGTPVAGSQAVINAQTGGSAFLQFLGSYNTGDLLQCIATPSALITGTMSNLSATGV